MMHVMDIVIYMSCLCFLGIFGREKQEKNKKKLGQFVVRCVAGARQIDPKWLPQQEICRAPGATPCATPQDARQWDWCTRRLDHPLPCA
jgi:hypothetical protein